MPCPIVVRGLALAGRQMWWKFFRHVAFRRGQMQFCGKNVLSLVERVFASKSFQYFLALVCLDENLSCIICCIIQLFISYICCDFGMVNFGWENRRTNLVGSWIGCEWDIFDQPASGAKTSDHLVGYCGVIGAEFERKMQNSYCKVWEKYDAWEKN